MSCETCKETLLTDGEEPPCFSASCWVPGMGPNGLMLGTASIRALEIRDRLISLHALGIGGEILRLYEATEEDLEMLAVIEDELKAKEERQKDE